MGYKRRRFQRQTGKLRYKKLFIIAAEGVKTEPEYFAALQTDNSVIKVHCLTGKTKSAPLQVLQRMEQHLKKESLKNSDEAWLVADRDCWEKSQLDQLYAWSLQKENYGFALSNPKFEYWLLLHFEDGESIASSRACSERLRRHLPDYDKGITSSKINREMVDNAIRRAAGRDTNRDAGWPVTTGTTVYRLAQNILAGNKG
jgi:hypothetical protein